MKSIRIISLLIFLVYCQLTIAQGPVITGPTIIPPGGATYQQPAPPLMGNVWECSPNISLTTVSNTEVFATGISAGDGYIILKNEALGIEIDRINVTVAGIIITNPSGRDVQVGKPEVFSAYDVGNQSTSRITYLWSVNLPSYATIISTSGINNEEATIIFSLSGMSYTVTAEPLCKYCDLLSGSKVVSANKLLLSPSYPNPTSDVFYVDLDKMSDEQNKTSKSFDISLFDSSGNRVCNERSIGGRVEFNASNYPNGIYFLHIYDVESKTTDIQKIVVKH